LSAAKSRSRSFDFALLRSGGWGTRLFVTKNLPSGAKQVEEKLIKLSEIREKRPSGVKTPLFLMALSARVNSCPFKTAPPLSFSATCEVVPFYKALSRRVF